MPANRSVEKLVTGHTLRGKNSELAWKLRFGLVLSHGHSLIGNGCFCVTMLIFSPTILFQNRPLRRAFADKSIKTKSYRAELSKFNISSKITGNLNSLHAIISIECPVS